MEEVALAGHAVVARGRVGHGGRKSRGRVALGEVASPKGRGRVGLASRPPREPTCPSESCRPWRPVGSVSCPRWTESPVCKVQSPFGKGLSRPSKNPVAPAITAGAPSSST